jgi:hypothetical protein
MRNKLIVLTVLLLAVAVVCSEMPEAGMWIYVGIYVVFMATLMKKEKGEKEMFIFRFLLHLLSGLPLVKWAFKNTGLAIGVIELILQFVAGVLIQLMKLALGLCNIFETDRSKDRAVNWIANAEAFVTWIETVFTKWKARAYKMGVKTPETGSGPA